MTTSLYSSKNSLPSFVKRRRHVCRCSGFSLVEVTLALGIVAFSVLTLMGMIPMGLVTFHKAAATSVSSQIVQQVVTDVQQTDFNQLVSPNTSVTRLGMRYFDDQGNELTSSTDPSAIYSVNVVVNTSVVLPGGSPSTPAANLACLAIEIVSNPGKVALQYNSSTQSVLPDTSNRISISRYSAFVAKNQ